MDKKIAQIIKRRDERNSMPRHYMSYTPKPVGSYARKKAAEKNGKN